MIKKNIFYLLLSGLLTTTIVFADAPVEDLSQGVTPADSIPSKEIVSTDTETITADAPVASQFSSANTVAMPMDQRVARLEKQLQNLTRMNLPQQISNMQQQIQQINGQLQVQEHELKQLNEQQRSFYQDLDMRIKHFKSLNTDGNDASSTPSDAAASKSNDVATSSNINMKDSASYNKAFKLLREKQYDRANAALQGYLSDFPNGAFQADAHFWLGEVAMLQKNLKQSAVEFGIVVKQFPKSKKVPDAKLKLAMIHAAQGNLIAARKEFAAIKQQYPNSTAAQLATIQLEQISGAR